MSEGTTFLQWREQAQAETREERLNLRSMLIVAGVVVVVGILAGVITLLLS